MTTERDFDRLKDPRHRADEILHSTRDREYAYLNEVAGRVIAAQDAEAALTADQPEPIDLARHLVSLGDFREGDRTPRPIGLERAAADIRSILDEPETADTTLAAQRTLTIQTLHEFAIRLLIARKRGELTADDSYARAISDLAVALSFQRPDPDADATYP